MLLSIIIVNYNVSAELDRCINSIFHIIKNLNFEILIIDNYSPDRSVERLQQKYPLVKFFFLKENLGFSRANNLGVNNSEGEYILLLNPDTVLIEDCITPILEFITQREKTGACSPLLLNEDMTMQNSFNNKMGFWYDFAEAFMIIKIYRYLLNVSYSKKIKTGNPFIVSMLGGAFLLMKKKVFYEAGGFNPEYFLNYEDLDLCKHINDNGYRNYLFPSLKCIHLENRSMKKDFEKFTYSRYYGRMVYAKNNYNKFIRAIVKVIHIFGIILRLLFVPLFYRGKEKEQRFNRI